MNERNRLTMTTILDVVDSEAIDREQDYERAYNAVQAALESIGPNVLPADLEAYVKKQDAHIGEVALMLAVSRILDN